MTKDNINNLRSISLSPKISKILETLLADQIVQYFDMNNLLFKFGFCNRKATVTAVMNNGYVGTILFDLKEAFDCLSSEIIEGKLRYYRFDEPSIQLLRYHLKSRRQYVSNGGDISNKKLTH